MENQPATPKIDFEIDDDFNAALVITCGNCSTVTKMPSEVLTPDKHIKCTGCDYEFKLTSDDINTIQTYLEDAKKLY